MDPFGRIILCLVGLLAIYALFMLYMWGGVWLVAGYAFFVHLLLKGAERLERVERRIQEEAAELPQPEAEKRAA